jgi:hypothetical protein
MTTPNDIAYHAGTARTDDMLRAAAEARRAERRGPRSTVRLGERGTLRSLVRRLRPA